MKVQTKRRIFSLITAVIMMSNMLFSIAFASGSSADDMEIPENAVYINNAEDFLEFAENCVSDSYSRGKEFYLTSDIDLEGKSISSIPVFCGVFNGNRHTIKGVKITDKGSYLGLFRYISEGAKVIDLKLSASVKPEGSMENIGVLCGENSGLIQRCTVEGYVNGETNIGGIAGHNTKTGVIENSVSKTNVYGNKNAGGVAGSNEGIISTCTSKCYVNTDADRTATNTGGIAGSNTGTIQYSYNYGAVGYKHSGYNVGGIAGIQNGLILNCANYAQIKGRKDIGGIAGQFEPNIEMSYGANQADKLRQEIKTLNGYMNSLANEISDSLGTTMDSMSNINGCMNSINGILTDSADYLFNDISYTSGQITGFIEDIESTGNDISGSSTNVITTIKHSIAASQQALRDLMEALKGSTTTKPLPKPPFIDPKPGHGEEGGEGGDSPLIPDLPFPPFDHEIPDLDLPDIEFPDVEITVPDVEAAKNAVVEYIRTMKSLSQAISDAMEKASHSITGGIGDVSTSIGSIQRSLNSTLGDQMDSMSDTTHSMHYYIDTVSKEIDTLTRLGRDSTTNVKNTARNIENQIDTVVDTVAETMKVPEFSIEDVSSVINSEPALGEIRKCQNFGQVRGDANTGGIAGIMAKELSADPEEDLFAEDKILVDTTAMFKALVLESTNNAQVTVKNEYGGGIAGRIEVGAVCESSNKGDITVEKGSFCGGIAGKSKGSIISCYVQAVLTGNDMVGGVAGQGADIEECYVMSVIDSEGEKTGSIAGTVDGNLFGNFFVDEGTAAIDGINYEGMAYPLSYEEFQQIEDIPKNFFVYRVNFIVNGNTIKTIPVEYGASLKEKDIPAVPEHEGKYGEWEEFDMENIMRTIDVNAVYTPLITTISTDEDIPQVLAEGQFTPFGKIKAEKPDNLPELQEREEIIQSVNIVIEDENHSLPDTFRVRIRTNAQEDDNIKVSAVNNGVFEELEYEMDGSYAVVTVPNNSTVAVIKVNPLISKAMVIGLSVSGAVLVVIAVGLIIYFVSKKKKSADVSQKDNKKSLEENSESDTIK